MKKYKELSKALSEQIWSRCRWHSSGEVTNSQASVVDKMPRNNATKHLKRNKQGGSGGTSDFQTYQHSPMYMDRFYGDASINPFSCFLPEEEEQESVVEGIMSMLCFENVSCLPYLVVIVDFLIIFLPLCTRKLCDYLF